MSTPLSHLIARSLMPALVVGAFALPAPIALAQQANATPPSPAEIERRKSMGGYLPERMQNPNLTSNPPRLTVTPLENIPVDNWNGFIIGKRSDCSSCIFTNPF